MDEHAPLQPVTCNPKALLPEATGTLLQGSQRQISGGRTDWGNRVAMSQSGPKSIPFRQELRGHPRGYEGRRETGSRFK